MGDRDFHRPGDTQSDARADTPEPAAVRRGCGFGLAKRVGLLREMVGSAAHRANGEGWVGDNGCGCYPMIIEKHLQTAFACADRYSSTLAEKLPPLLTFGGFGPQELVAIQISAFEVGPIVGRLVARANDQRHWMPTAS